MLEILGFAFDLKIALMTSLVVFVQGLASYYEGTLLPTSRCKPMIAFLYHCGASWADGLVLPAFNGLVWPHLHPSTLLVSAVAMPCLLMTHIGHRSWYRRSETGHMWPTYTSGIWYRDMGLAGWTHYFFMVLQSTIMGLYVFTPMPHKVVWAIAVVMIPFIVLAGIQPRWYLTGKLVNSDTPTVLITTLVKLR